MANNKWVEAKKSPIHGWGVFAKRRIPKGTHVIEYVGLKLTKEEADEVDDTRYLFALDDTYDIDGNVPWNVAGYINHSCDPNCESENIDGRIWITALREIKPGEELSYNYGYDLEDMKDYPCNCGSKNCIGYILDKDLWKHVKAKKKRK